MFFILSFILLSSFPSFFLLLYTFCSLPHSVLLCSVLIFVRFYSTSHHSFLIHTFPSLFFILPPYFSLIFLLLFSFISYHILGSKLTLVLKDSFTRAKARTVMITTISPVRFDLSYCIITHALVTKKAK